MLQCVEKNVYFRITETQYSQGKRIVIDYHQRSFNRDGL